MCFGVNSVENLGFSLCLSLLRPLQVKKPQRRWSPSYVDHLTSHLMFYLRQFLSPPQCLVLYLEMNRAAEEWKNMSNCEGCIFPTTQRSSRTIVEMGTFPPTAGDRLGVKVADRQGVKVVRGYIMPSSVCVMMLKGCLPVLLTRIIITDELNSTAHIKETLWMTSDIQCYPNHNATSHIKSLFWCFLRLQRFSKPDTW